jgi:serine protease Do
MRLLAILIAAAFAVPIAAGRPDEPSKEDLLRFEKQLKAAYAGTGSSIVCIVVSRSDKYPVPLAAEPGRLGGFDHDAFLRAEPTQRKLAEQLDLSKPETIPDHGFAGGIVIDPSGLVLTNYRAIEGATKIFVHVPGGTGSYADIRAADERSDLAVLKLATPPAGLNAARFGRARLPDTPNDPRATVAPGTLALLAAYPYASGAVMDRPNAGLAIVSKIRHPERKREKNRNNTDLLRSIYRYAPLLELDARLNAGTSSAAVLNLDGQVVALTTAAGVIPPEEGGPVVALPLDDNLVRIIGVLRRGEEVEYGFLGVTQPELPARVRGIALERLPMRGSPAHAAGLLPGDVITRIDDHPVSTFEDLLLYIGSGLAGGEIKVHYDRNGQGRDAVITLAKFKNDMAYIATVRPQPVFGLRVDYTSVVYQSFFNPFGRGLVEIPGGVHVRELLPNSPAAVKFKALGENNRWVITQINGKAVYTPSEFYKEAKGQKSVKLTVTDPTEGNGRRDATVILP